MNTAYGRAAPGDFLYLLAFGFYLFFAVLQSSFYRNILPKESRMNAVLFVLLIALALREFAFEVYNPRDFLLLFAAVLISVNALVSGTFYLAFPFLLIYFGRSVSPRLLFTFAAWLTFILLFFIIVSSYAGLIPNYVRHEMKRKTDREFLGFLFALYPGAFFFNGAALLLAVRGRRIRFITLAVVMAANTWLYIKTDGRLSFVLTALLIGAFVVAKLAPGFICRLRPLFFIAVPAFPVCAAVSLILTYRYNSSIAWMRKLNKILGRRLFHGRTSLNRFGAGLFGREVRWVGYGLNEHGHRSGARYLYVDNLYVNFLQRFGWIALILALVLLTWAIFRIYRARRYELLIIFLLLALHSLIDDRILYLSYNTFWIAAVHALNRGYAQKEEWDYESIA